MTGLLKQFSPLVSLVRFLRGRVGLTPEKLSHRYHLDRRDWLITSYFEKYSVRKLQIGCQANPLEGWLNVDIYPLENTIAYMDATKPFCLENESVDFVFSEHMIEHISFESADFMLSECHRVLKRGGGIRLSTPDLSFLVRFYSNPTEEAHERYRRFNERYFPDRSVPLLPSMVVNNFFRDWGHQFIHDRSSLTFLLEKSGFRDIVFKEVGKSNVEAFNNLEKHGVEITDEFNRLESLVVEATK